MEKTLAHPLFSQKLIDLKFKTLAKIANYFLSLGGISYYIFDETFSTRIVLFNYASHYANDDFPCDWKIILYSSSGEKIFSKEGTFVGQATVVVDLEEIKPKSKYGIVVAHIKPNNKGKILSKSYDSIFFTEHYNRDNLYHDVAHSLRWPTSFKYLYNITGHGFSILSGAKAYLMIGNSYDAKIGGRNLMCVPTVELTNYMGKVRKVELSPIAPMGCIRADLNELFPDLKDHFVGQPGMIKVIGANVIRKPFFYQTNGSYISSDHL
ncbi:MAG: hypothetical protein AAB392_02200 [Patescibacteria group bacterium]